MSTPPRLARLLAGALIACAPTSDPVGACIEGEPSLTLTLAGEPLADGDPVTPVNAGGEAALSLGGTVIGLADAEAWTGVFRVRAATGASNDAIGAVAATCAEDGARVGLSVPLGMTLDEAADAAGRLEISASITDEGGRSAEQTLSLELTAP